MIDPSSISEPQAKREPTHHTIHGIERIDEYRWLQDKSSPEVIAHLEAENAYAHALLAHTEALQQTLYQEMLGRINQTDLSVPYRRDGYYYYARTVEGLQYPIHCRRRGTLDADEEVILDVNALAEGHGYTAVGAFEVSDDGRYLAFTLDTVGFREYTLFVKDLRDGALLADRVEHVAAVAWPADSSQLFYVTEDDTKRSSRLWRHRLGESDDRTVWYEPDERFSLQIQRTNSRRFLILTAASHTTSEEWLIEANDPDGDPVLIEPRRQDVRYSADHHGEHLYIVANDTGRNGRLVRTRIDTPGAANWEELIAHRDDVMIEGLDPFAGHYVVVWRRDGLTGMTVRYFDDRDDQQIEFPEEVYEAFPGTNAEWETEVYRYRYSSPVTPSSVYDYDVPTRERTLMKQLEVLGGYDQTQYVAERLYATADDGTRIPISVVRRRDVAVDATAPLLLRGYGAYGYPHSVGFSTPLISLFDRGVVYAVAHVRGGGELGKTWHDAGRMFNKMNSFTDFNRCAEYLVERRYAGKDRVVSDGGSAGGLLVCAAANIRPDLYRAVLAIVPFVDVINTMLDPTLPLTVGEFEEWGNPEDPEAYRYISGYCPYTNIGEHYYPTMLVRTSLNDSQVMYWEPAKFVARLRERKSGTNPVMLMTNMGAGHGGSSGRYDFLRETALDYAFILDSVGISE